VGKSDSAGKVLTTKEVEHLIATRGLDDVDELVCSITAIEDGAAVLLGKHNVYLPLNRLRQLSVAAAKALARTDSHLCLDGLTSLTPELAEALAKRPKNSQSLSLGGITTIGVEEARTLAKVASYRLVLGLTSLSDAIAEELGKREGDLCLDELVTLSDHAAACLSKVRGNLSLGGVTTLSDVAAKSLGKLKSSFSDGHGLDLEGLTSLSTAACVALSKVIYGEYGFCTNPMKPGRPVDPHRSEKRSLRDQIFFGHLFADRVEKRAEKIKTYADSPAGKKAIKACESAIDSNPQCEVLRDCLSISVASAVKLSTRTHGIRCPGFLGFHDAEEEGHDWRAVGDAVVRYLQKVPGFGPRCAAMGGLLIELMLASGETAALGQLLRVAREIKITDTREWIETRVAWKAHEIGSSPQAIEDTTIDTHGFGDQPKEAPKRKAAKGSKGKKTGKAAKVTQAQVNDGAKTFEVVGLGTVEISVRSGKPECFLRDKDSRESLDLKTLRRKNKEAANCLSVECKAIEATLRDCKKRLESSWCSPATWSWEDLKRCWFEHPLVSCLATRLIWRFENSKDAQEGLWDGSGFTDSRGKRLGDISAATRVRLWHPAHSPKTVEGWRRRLLDEEIEQPFRQAFREVYLVTDAERNAENTSARFAGHVLQQSQFAALCRDRGWSVSLVGPFDSSSGAEKSIREYKLSIGWGGEPVGDETAGTFYRYIRMTAVRFNLPITEIPPIVFSEITRDLDLFVSVSSIGVDPSWNSTEAIPALRQYWDAFTSGDLSESGRLRREALEMLLPSLPSSKQFKLEKKHLVVRGTLGTYSIHLQSGAVFKAPGNQHVCIVPKAASADTSLALLVGDPMLSMIVSKALLLANDDKIKDRSILAQIS
jgi:hypothetical protein